MRSNFFWGTLIVIVGGLFLLQNLGILNVNIWNLLWPFFLIALGAWIILGRFFPNRAAIDHAVISLDGARKALVTVQHGAGRLTIRPGDSSVNLIEGDFGGGLEAVERMVGEIKEVTMKPRIEGLIFPWGPDQALHWDFSLAPNIPLELKLETGANDAYADLTSLLVERLSLKSGASSTHILLPANAGQTWVNIETGVTSVHLTIPPQVAGRIHYSGGLSSIQIDSGRFPKSGNSYQSPDFDTASNKVDIKIDTGIGSVIID
jgi:hypothetical protein